MSVPTFILLAVLLTVSLVGWRALSQVDRAIRSAYPTNHPEYRPDKRSPRCGHHRDAAVPVTLSTGETVTWLCTDCGEERTAPPKRCTCDDVRDVITIHTLDGAIARWCARCRGDC